MKVQKFPEGEGEHLDLHITAGEIGRQFRREQVGVGASHINITVQVHTEGIDGVLPIRYLLHLVQKEIEPFALGGAFHDVLIQTLAVQVGKPHGLKIHREKLVFCDALLP